VILFVLIWENKGFEMKISVIGAAGTLGSCISFNIITHKLADEIVLIDPFQDALTGHWLDLKHASTGCDINIVKGSYPDMVGTDIVVVTAGAPTGAIKQRSDLLPGSMPIIKEASDKINEFCPKAIVILETNPVDPLNYEMYLLSKERDSRRFLGYSMNDTIRLRHWIAEAYKVPSSSVEGMVIGEHGTTQVMLFSTVKINGKTVKVDEETKKQIRGQPVTFLGIMENLKPRRTAGWLSAAGTVKVINAIKNNTGEVLPCNVIQEGEYGCKGLSMTTPVTVGKEGLRSVIKLPLAADEQEGLKNTVNALSPLMRIVEDFVGHK
jgi:malate dehydrogenase